MSQEFPRSLAAKSTSEAFADGAFWVGLVCLGAAFVGILSIALAVPSFEAWPVFPALGLMVIGAIVLFLQRTPNVVVTAVVAGLETAGIAWYSATIFIYQNAQPSDPRGSSDTLFVTLATIAVTMFGVTAGKLYPGVASIVIAYVLAEGTVILFAIATDHTVTPDVMATGVLLVLVLVVSLVGVSRSRARAVEPVIVRAQYDDTEALSRERAANRVSALVHDTVLNELAVVSTRPAGPVPAEVRDRIAASIASVVGENARAGGDVEPAERIAGAVADAVDRARTGGLTVTVEGDTHDLSVLPASVATALGLAVGQCLENVANHSGTDVAELAVISGRGILTVMVVDSGKGFSEDGVKSDRLGLRNSVRKRIEGVGGTVQVWTTEGVGTTVSMTVPLP